MSTSADLESVQSFRHFPLFAGLAPALVEELAARTRRQIFHAGEVIFRRGELGQTFYLITRGRIRIFGPTDRGEEIINELHAGEWFGEMALITGEPRSATAVAAIEAVLIILTRDEFQQLLTHAPSVALELSHALSQRLSARMLSRPRPKPPQVIVVLSAAFTTPVAMLLLNLAATFANVGTGTVAIVASAAFPILSSIIARAAPDGVTVVDGSVHDIHRLREEYSILLFPFTPSVLEATAIIQNVDAVWVLDLDNGQASDWLKNHPEITLGTTISCADKPVSADNTDLLVLGSDALTIVPLVRLSPQSASAKNLRRFARRCLGKRLGLALSAGGAKGLAHLGVVRCLESAGIEFDIIAGTSMGGIIGGLLALGWNSTELLHSFEELALHLRHRLLDFGISETALLRGEKKRLLLREHAGATYMEELPIPCRIVAADLMSGREVVCSSGPLWQAMEATSAIPAIFPPMVQNDRVLVDGWIVNPLPTNVLRRENADFIVAVATSARMEPLTPLAISTPAKRPGQWLGDLRRRFTKPAILRIAMRALDVGACERTLASLAMVDVGIQPDVGAFSPADFGAIGAIVERGEQAAEAALPEIKKVLQRK